MRNLTKLKVLTSSLLVISTLTCFCLSSSFAASDSKDSVEEYKNMEQVMGSIKLEKKQVESMVDKMVASGRISADDASKAKRELASMNDNDFENLKTKAIAEVKDKHLLNDH